MLAKLPDTNPRRVAVIMGTSGSGQSLLDALRPLLGKDLANDLQGVFVVDDTLQTAAALPFVKELCRLTWGVREFQSSHFEQAIELRIRTARKAVAELAQRMGVSHSFENVQGSTVGLLQETAHRADITVFESLQMFKAAPAFPPARKIPAQPRIVVAVDDLVSGTRALIAAILFAGDEMHRLSVLNTAKTTAEQDAIDQVISTLIPDRTVRTKRLSKPGLMNLIAAARAENAGMLVLGTTEKLLKPESLRSLREELSCPVCLVRRWHDDTDSPATQPRKDES
mgnify:CR=1 FL=1